MLLNDKLLTMQTTINTDGGSRGNPGLAACAFVVTELGVVKALGSKFLGIQTNNYAEYQGVIIALEWLLKNHNKILNEELVFLLDSELVVKQLNGVYKVKDVNLKILHTQILNTVKNSRIKISFKHIPRHLNKEADKLVNEEMDRNS